MPIRILIADDSALMRRHFVQTFNEQGGFEIFTARNGREAVEENLRQQPDVVLLDINMPEMDGLSALALIRQARPVPVIMVSSLTHAGALATFEALALGAVDYVPKPEGTISLSIDQIKDQLISKVRSAINARPAPPPRRGGVIAQRMREEQSTLREQRQRMQQKADGLVLIGVSTGGPGTLEQILPQLPEDFPYPVIVAQHMPAAFTGPFAERMNHLCALDVLEARQLMPVERGKVYIARGGADLVLCQRGQRLHLQPQPESAEHLWHPSVERLGRSALEHCQARHLIAVMLTGMGDDGAAAFTQIHHKGGRTIAESQDTAIVFGMPKELIQHGGASIALPADRIAQQLIQWACH
jgi:two-component system, chemotaxis family, protein-glutamate methylesterase/glutaminase